MLSKYRNIFRNQLILVGPYPPPIGGVSTHIERILPLLESKGIRYHLFNHGFFEGEKITSTGKRYSWWIKFFFVSLLLRSYIRKSKAVIHFHIITFASYPFVFLFYFLITHRIFISIHNDDVFKYSPVKKALYRVVISRLSECRIICVSKRVTEYNSSIRKGSSIYLPALIMPATGHNLALPHHHDPGKKLVCACIGKLNDQKIIAYGFDLLFRLLADFKDMILYVFVGYETGSEEDLIRKKYLEPALLDRVYFVYGKEFVSYVHNFSLFLRPNREDGFGVSVAEALLSGVLAIASDTCERIPGVTLFKSGDYDDLKQKYELCREERSSNYPAEVDGNTYAVQLLALYQEAIAR